MLNEIGFEADVEDARRAGLLRARSARRHKAQTGFADWFQDFPHPGDFIESLLSTRAIQSDEQPSTRAFVNDPEIDKQLDELRPEPDPERRPRTSGPSSTSTSSTRRRTSPPYGTEESSSFLSDRMDFENCTGVHPVYGNDWLLFCKK